MAHVPHIADPNRKEWEKKHRPKTVEPVEQKEAEEKPKRSYRKRK